MPYLSILECNSFSQGALAAPDGKIQKQRCFKVQSLRAKILYFKTRPRWALRKKGGTNSNLSAKSKSSALFPNPKVFAGKGGIFMLIESSKIFDCQSGQHSLAVIPQETPSLHLRFEQGFSPYPQGIYGLS